MSVYIFSGSGTTSQLRNRKLSTYKSGSLPDSPKYQLNNVHSVNNIDLPVQTLSMSKLCSKYQVVKKLPVTQYENAKPLLLIGLDNGYLGAPTNSSIKSVNNEPIAVKTKLGWLVYGPCDFSQPSIGRNISLHISPTILDSCEVDDQRFDDIINNFFTAESFGVKPSSIDIESNSDKRAKELLRTTTRKTGDRYQTVFYGRLQTSSCLQASKWLRTDCYLWREK